MNSVSTIFNQWIKNQIRLNSGLWLKEVHALYRNFPHLIWMEHCEDDFKQRYDRLYPQIQHEQMRGYRFLLENKQHAVLASEDNVYEEIEQQSELFQNSTLVKRKALLQLWNHRIAKQLIQKAGFQAKIITFQGLTAFSELTLTYLLKRCPNLYSLTIFKCSFYHLPQNFGHLRKLVQFIVQKSLLKALPNTFRRLTSLKEVVLEETQLSYFPMLLTKLPVLKKLQIGQNLITELPKSLVLEKFLQKIHLDSKELLNQQRKHTSVT